MIQRISCGTKASPGANSSVTLYDDNPKIVGQDTGRARVHVMAHVDQNFTINTWWAKDSTSPLRLVSSDAYVAGTAGHVAPVKATQPITCVAVANLANNDYFSVTVTVTRSGVVESTTAVVFEYQVDEEFVATEGRTAIDVSALTTDVEVAVATAAAVVAALGAAVLEAAAPTTATFTLKSAVSGTSYALSATENVANAGFTIGTATAGVDGTIVRHNTLLGPGRTKIELDTGTAPVEFDVAVETYDDPNPGV